MLSRLQARQLQSPLQLRFAPVAGCFLVALQRHRQVAGLAVHFQAHFQHLLNFLLQGGIAFERFRVHFVNAGLEARDLLSERF